MVAFLRWALLAMLCLPVAALAQSERPPLRIEVNRGEVQPMPFAAPVFLAETEAAAGQAAALTEVIVANLTGSGLFREIPREAHIGRIARFDDPVRYTDWAAINAQALITGAVSATEDGRLAVKFRLWDVFGQTQVGDGQQIVAEAGAWRRIAHKVSDVVYARLTGEAGYFDSRIVFVSETGPKAARRKQVAVMDQDGANLRYVTRDTDIVLAPRWSPNNRDVIYTSYESGRPQVYLLNAESLARRPLGTLTNVSFAPRFSPDGNRVVYSESDGANTDIYEMDLATGQRRRLTQSSAIETAPSYSPDGSQIVFESDRGGSQQLYVMPAGGGEARRISFGDGRYGTPVWSPRGDQIAFTKMLAGRFHIGVMRTDGSRERLLTASFLDEAPSWSPNGRVVVFYRETAGEDGAPALYSVDITGRNLKRLPTPAFASDPHWSGRL